MRHIFYTGNGTAPAGVARPHVGRFFTIDDDGALRYFRYDAFGEQDPTGANGFVGNNSGNQIGRGFATLPPCRRRRQRHHPCCRTERRPHLVPVHRGGRARPHGNQRLRGEQPRQRDRQRLPQFPPLVCLTSRGPDNGDDDLRRRREWRSALVPVRRPRRARPHRSSWIRRAQPRQPDRPRLPRLPPHRRRRRRRLPRGPGQRRPALVPVHRQW